MKTSLKRTLALSILPVAALLLSGCGFNQEASVIVPSNKQEAAPQTPAPLSNEQQARLSTLPADNKQAIDSELQGIDKELNDVDASIAATDIPDGELGL